MDGPAPTMAAPRRPDYLLPEELVRMLDAEHFTIDDIFGDFEEAAFQPGESEHLVIIARRGSA